MKAFQNIFERFRKSDAILQHKYGAINVQVGDASLTNEQRDRLNFAYSYYGPRLKQMAEWVFSSNEKYNFTYDVTKNSKAAFIGAVSAASGKPMAEIARFIEEPYADSRLTDAVVARAGSDGGFDTQDTTCLFGRRLAWYATARAMKPRVIVETGVDFGLGSILLAEALRRNAEEGHPGHHYGTDINHEAGFLVHGPWAPFSTMLYGDSIESLTRFDQPIDLFINDSDHSAEYEMREYRLLPGKLGASAIVLGDNSHVTDALYQWSVETGRQFLFCPEFPKDHWYPGAGIGFSFTAKRTS
jgi:predicted O-methyltransferase YrrM